MKNWSEKFDNWILMRREVDRLISYNNDPMNRHNLLLFSEATVSCAALERLLRILPAIKANPANKETLSDLLNRALGTPKKPGLLHHYWQS